MRKVSPMKKKMDDLKKKYDNFGLWFVSAIIHTFFMNHSLQMLKPVIVEVIAVVDFVESVLQVFSIAHTISQPFLHITDALVDKMGKFFLTWFALVIAVLQLLMTLRFFGARQFTAIDFDVEFGIVFLHKKLEWGLLIMLSLLKLLLDEVILTSVKGISLVVFPLFITENAFIGGVAIHGTLK